MVHKNKPKNHKVTIVLWINHFTLMRLQLIIMYAVRQLKQYRAILTITHTATVFITIKSPYKIYHSERNIENGYQAWYALYPLARKKFGRQYSTLDEYKKDFSIIARHNNVTCVCIYGIRAKYLRFHAHTHARTKTWQRHPFHPFVINATHFSASNRTILICSHTNHITILSYGTQCTTLQSRATRIENLLRGG